MALSDYDTLAVDLVGDPTDGAFRTPNGFEVEIYKNWLYLRDPRMWAEGESFVRPTIAEVSEGQLRIAGCRIHARRGRTKDSVLVYVEHDEYQPQVAGEPYRPPIVTGMAGIGCRGYIQDEDWIDDGREEYDPDQYRWAGIEQAEVDELRAFLEEINREHGTRAVPPLDAAVRFNQGDAFFARKIGDPGVAQVTEPGQAAPTILSQLTRGMADGD